MCAMDFADTVWWRTLPTAQLQRRRSVIRGFTQIWPGLRATCRAAWFVPPCPAPRPSVDTPFSSKRGSKAKHPPVARRNAVHTAYVFRCDLLPPLPPHRNLPFQGYFTATSYSPVIRLNRQTRRRRRCPQNSTHWR